MSGALLETKLHIPRPRRAPVGRPRLSGHLNRSWAATLTLVSAPAGFGKTTLVADWTARAADGRCAAWLSLDERDSNPIEFWTYVIASLQTVAPAVGSSASRLLRSSQASVDAALHSLLNDLAALTHHVVLVLDDYHLIDALDVHSQLAYLLEHLPPQAHVVLATRVDPALPLARLRARGELVEIRAADLRFTAGEAEVYLRHTMGLHLTEDDIAALDQRTEGWIAALQLAALSMQGRDDPAAFIAQFAGDDQYVVDYLVEEVLQRQPPEARDFLLSTSLLDRLSSDLCDAVTGSGDSARTLLALDRQNLFLIALDDRRRWYRYHHLFADVLRARLLAEQPGRVPELHRRASAWYEANAQLAEAVDHALRADDHARAARLIAEALPAMRRDRREADLRRWIRTLPDALVRDDPSLTLGLVGALMAHSELDGVERRLQDAERWLRSSAAEAADAAFVRTIASTVAVYRSGQARISGDVDGTVVHAQRVLELSADDDHLERGAAAALLALSHWSRADLGEAHRRYTEALRHLLQAGHVSDVLGCTIALADLEMARGHLDAAEALFRRGLRLADEAEHVPRGTADMHTGLAAVLVERNELAGADEHVQAAEALGWHAGLPQNPYRSLVVRAQVLHARGKLDEAIALLQAAEDVYDTDYSPDVRPVNAMTARLQLLRGRTREARQWAHQRGVDPRRESSYLREYEHLTAARVLLADLPDGGQDAASQLDDLLARLLRAAQAGERVLSAVDAQVLQALAAHAQGRLTEATDVLQRAVATAERCGLVRTVIDHGPALAPLLTALVRRTNDPYARRLLAAVDPAAAADSSGRQSCDHAPLSDRELDVLRLLATELDGPDIARRLVVSVNTMRTHTRSIYTKLGVSSRRAAVSRAHQLGLLSRTRNSSPWQRTQDHHIPHQG